MTRLSRFSVLTLLLGSVTLATAIGCGDEGGEMAVLDVYPRQVLLTGEQPIQIKGVHFRTDIGYTIYFGTTRAEQVSILDTETLVAVAPPRTEAGPVDITISADNGDAFVIREAFTYAEASDATNAEGHLRY